MELWLQVALTVGGALMFAGLLYVALRIIFMLIVVRAIAEHLLAPLTVAALNGAFALEAAREQREK